MNTDVAMKASGVFWFAHIVVHCLCRINGDRLPSMYFRAPLSSPQSAWQLLFQGRNLVIPCNFDDDCIYIDTLSQAERGHSNRYVALHSDDAAWLTEIAFWNWLDHVGACDSHLAVSLVRL